MPPLHWFDAHLDLACLAVLGRDMHARAELAGGPWQPASITLASLKEGKVARALATIFTEAGGSDSGVSYSPGDARGANQAGLAQLAVYEQWKRDGVADFPLLMECADPIIAPGDLPRWVRHGVRAVGLAWGRGSRYASGNMVDPHEKVGLTGQGRELVREMDRLGVVHDASHLSDRALDELFEATGALVIASHSNCRAIIASRPMHRDDTPAPLRDHPRGKAIAMQRHLSDASIREIIRRGGVIGINLYSPFLIPGGVRARRAGLHEVVAHIDHVCEIAGNCTHVGLGSDMDGGFSAAMLPGGINTPSDLVRIAEALHDRNWSDEHIHAFAHANWERLFGAPSRGNQIRPA